MPSIPAAASLPPDPRAEPLSRALRAGGDAALARLDGLRAWKKPDGTALTDADLAAHEAIVEALGEAFPGEAVLSEEGPVGRAPTTGAVWFVDPVDGTDAMVEGLAHWGPTACRVVDGKLDVGAFWLPRTGELWFAGRGAGAWLDGRRLAPPEPTRPGSASVYLPSRSHRMPAVAWHGKMRALGSSAAHLAQVARGSGGATVVADWKLWDVGCGILLVEEAGRVVVGLDGQPFDPLALEGQPLVAAARSVLPLFLDAVHAALSDFPGFSA